MSNFIQSQDVHIYTYILYTYNIFRHVASTTQTKTKNIHAMNTETQGAKEERFKSVRSILDQAMKSRGLLKPPFLFMYCL